MQWRVEDCRAKREKDQEEDQEGEDPINH